jgi:hypothetical protein
MIFKTINSPYEGYELFEELSITRSFKFFNLIVYRVTTIDGKSFWLVVKKNYRQGAKRCPSCYGCGTYPYYNEDGYRVVDRCPYCNGTGEIINE